VAKLTEEVVNMIKNLESCRLQVYKDIAGLNTVGYGHRTDMAVGQVITQDTADSFLHYDLVSAATLVNHYIHVPLSDNQFGALISLVFNVGVHPLERTLGEILNNGNYLAAADQFLRWDHAVVDGQTVEVPGLKDRRQIERSLFLRADQT